MEYRLLIDVEVLDYLQTLRPQVRARLLDRFRRIREYPSAWSDYKERDATDRLLDVCVREKHAIFYWEDFADRHVKILAIRPADMT